MASALVKRASFVHRRLSISCRLCVPRLGEQVEVKSMPTLEKVVDVEVKSMPPTLEKVVDVLPHEDAAREGMDGNMEIARIAFGLEIVRLEKDQGNLLELLRNKRIQMFESSDVPIGSAKVRLSPTDFKKTHLEDEERRKFLEKMRDIQQKYNYESWMEKLSGFVVYTTVGEMASQLLTAVNFFYKEGWNTTYTRLQEQFSLKGELQRENMDVKMLADLSEVKQVLNMVEDRFKAEGVSGTKKEGTVKKEDNGKESNHEKSSDEDDSSDDENGGGAAVFERVGARVGKWVGKALWKLFPF